MATKTAPPPTVDASGWLEEQYRKDPGLRDRVEGAMVEMEVIEALVAMRAAAGLSQRALAQKLGIAQPTLAKIESSGTKNIGLETLGRIAAALGARMRISFEPMETKGAARPAAKRRRTA